MSGAMQSNVGNPQVYNDGDQRPNKVDVGQHVDGFSGGKKNSHGVLDSKDQRSHANTTSAASELHREEKKQSDPTDPLAPALSHGNEPSKGAKIDAELQAEEEEYLKKKSS